MREKLTSLKLSNCFNLLEDLRERLAPPVRKTQPCSKRIRVEPSLRAEIEYRAKSAEGTVRHPFFRGLREDLWSRHPQF